MRLNGAGLEGCGKFRAVKLVLDVSKEAVGLHLQGLKVLGLFSET
jgi:hypothetical protein